MDELTLAELCRRYALGEPQAPPEPVPGGLLHHVYRLQTTGGGFAVKVLNPTVMQYADVRENFRRSERVAAAVAAHALPAVTALKAAGDVIHDIGPVSVMVFPWVDARALSSASAEPDQARLIGGLLGRIHTLPLHFAELTPPDLSSVAESEDDEWGTLADDAERKPLAWASEVRALIPQILSWVRSSAEARQAFGNKWVISHSDLDQKNVLWSDEHTPWLIDWECGGYVQPAIEAVGGALDWGGQAAGALDVATFQAFLEGYRREAPLTAQDVGYGLQAYCGSWCGWLKFNMQRSLGLVTNDPEEQTLGTRETFSTLTMLRSASVNIPTLEQGL